MKKERQKRLTFKDQKLISVIQSINSSLILRQALGGETGAKSFPILESMETCWTDPIYIQIKEKYVKGRTLLRLLEERSPSFLHPPKALYLQEGDLSSLFTPCANTWEDFEAMVVSLLEQAFLRAHYEKVEIEAEKTAVGLMTVQKGCEKKKKKRPLFSQYDLENLVVDLSSETSTDTDVDPADLLFFDASMTGSRSYHTRLKYRDRKLDISAEMLSQIQEELSDVHIDWEDLDELAVVRDYYAQYPPYYYWGERGGEWERFYASRR